MTFAVAPDLTPYRNVSSVLPAHLSRWSRSGSKHQKRFWGVSQHTIRYTSASDYEQHFRAAFASAVKARLRSTRPVWAELSGGLDSSAIVCMADRVSDAEGSTFNAVETLSLISDAAPETDERPFILAVEDQCHRSGHHIKIEACTHLRDDRWGWVSPLHPVAAALAMTRFVENHGGRVVLSGNAGDLTMMNVPEELGSVFEAIESRRLSDAISRAHAWCRSNRKPIWHLLGQFAKRSPTLGRVSRALCEEARGFNGGVPTRDPCGTMTETFCLTNDSAGIWHEQAMRRASNTAATRPLSKLTLLKGLREWVDARLPCSAPEVPVHITHPYLDRQIVQFMLSVPADVLCRPGQPRRLMKRALADVLPERVAKRFSKGYIDPLTTRLLRAEAPSILPRVPKLEIVQRGFVDAERLRRALETVLVGTHRHIGNLERVIKTERWFTVRDSKLRERSHAS
jgi:asparagine synthase (glutamine-hydrolysing)